MARRELNPRAVVEILDAVLDARLCSPAELREELRVSSRRGTALVRQVLSHLYPT